jgi:hypothetical protein
MTIPVVTNGTYTVGSGDVTFEAAMGDGHTGFISISLNGSEVAFGNDSARAELGPGDPLRGSEVEVFARVSRMSPASRNSMIYDWNGGPAPRTDVASGNFDVNGEPTPYQAIYRLT